MRRLRSCNLRPGFFFAFFPSAWELRLSFCKAPELYDASIASCPVGFVPSYALRWSVYRCQEKTDLIRLGWFSRSATWIQLEFISLVNYCQNKPEAKTVDVLITLTVQIFANDRLLTQQTAILNHQSMSHSSIRMYLACHNSLAAPIHVQGHPSPRPWLLDRRVVATLSPRWIQDGESRTPREAGADHGIMGACQAGRITGSCFLCFIASQARSWK